MEITQTYARPSGGTMAPDGMHLDVSAERSRAPVHLEAMVHDSLGYARLMLALYEVVSGDFRAQAKDHTAYQEWVQQRYLEELSGEMKSRAANVPGLLARQADLGAKVAALNGQIRALQAVAYSADFYRKRGEYFHWLRRDMDAWWVLDPVVSVHPDCLIFEVFSQDESSYGRVTVPTEELDVFGQAAYGTTNIDFSRRLADEFARVRSYRPAWLQIGAEGVGLATGAGDVLEKKIDLPPSWVRGFLQVQSASASPATALTLSAETVAETLSLLRRRHEKVGPRSLRFHLTPGERPSITVDPWDAVVQEPTHVFEGKVGGTIRIWGRRRLFALEALLPHADRVDLRLLGPGMPSYWTVFQGAHRFDLGLSGWTKNDWAQAARFDLLSATATATDADVETASDALSAEWLLSPEAAARKTGLTRETATAAMQTLCAQGQAMFDPAVGGYRWRPMLPVPMVLDTPEDKKMAKAKRIVAQKNVKWQTPAESDGPRAFGAGAEGAERVEASVRDGETQTVTLDVDADGRVAFAACTCPQFRRDKLKSGPCQHILAAAALAPDQVAAQVAARAAVQASGPDPALFVGKTFVFTGTLTLYTREEAERIVTQAGGHASGSVGKGTSYVIVGEKAGSKKKRAEELGIPVLTEAQFKAML